MSENYNFNTQCLYAASYIAYEYCSEYAYAVEEGLRLANTEFRKQEIEESVGDDVKQEDADIILESVRSKAGYAIDCIQEDRFQIHEKEFFRYSEEKTYKYRPEITMRATPLDRRYHKVAKKIIECVFAEYQAIIEGAKVKGLTALYASRDRTIAHASRALVSAIHDGCRSFRLSLFEIRREIGSILSVKPVGQQDVISQDAKLNDMVGHLFQHDDTKAAPEKRKELPESATQVTKKARQEDANVCNYDDSSDDDFRVMEVRKATGSEVSGAISSNRSVDSARRDIHSSAKTTLPQANSSFMAQTVSATPPMVSNRVLEPVRSVHGRNGLEEELGLASRRNEPSSSSSSSVKGYKIDEILEKGVEVTLDLIEEIRPGIEAILNHFEKAGLVRILKAGLSLEAKQLIEAMMNGDDVIAKRIKRMHDKGTQEGKISVMMLFIASITDFRQGTEKLTKQSTYKTFITLSSQPQNSCINQIKNKDRVVSKAAYNFLNAENTQNCEKLCVPIWTLTEAVEGGVLSAAPTVLTQLFKNDDHFLHEVAHLVRCTFIVICWTLQNEQLDGRMRKIYKRGKPFVGLNNIIPFEFFYNNSAVKNKGRSGHQKTLTATGEERVAEKISSEGITATEESKAKYVENAKLLLGSGLKRTLMLKSHTQKGNALGINAYLSAHMRFNLYLTAEWLEGKNMMEGDSVMLKLIIGSRYQYTTETKQTGAKLVIRFHDEDGERQEHQVFVSPSYEAVIKTILNDREKGKFS